MPRKMLSTCAEPGCPELTRATRCGPHAYRQQKRWAPNRPTGPRWARLCRTILARDPICRACGKELATEVDHAVPLRDGGEAWDQANLQGLCHDCHAAKSAREDREHRYPTR